jgi:hypothetical protein
MKILLLPLFLIFFNIKSIEKNTLGGHKLTTQEAERILGESCQLKESSNSLENGGHKYKSTYLANSSDEKLNKIIALNFMFESYGDEKDAQKMFETFKLSNEKLERFEIINNIGDEGFFHTDNKNFYLIIVRKGNELVRFKVNKITTKTSLIELKKVANDLVGRI